MLHALDVSTELETFESDVLIVGSGAVGLLMAIDLARKGENVVLLEAGSNSVTSDSQRFFETAISEGMNLEGLHLGRFRALGGTTHFWGGQLVPMSPIVFEDRPWLGNNTNWPIGFDELSPFYDSVFDILGMRDVLRSDSDVSKASKCEIGGLPETVEYFYTRWTPESNFARLFAAELKSLTNLRVYMNAPVTGIVAGETSDKILGVSVIDVQGRKHTFVSKNVVLANGTIEIARLLMMPLACGKRPVWHDSPWLGKGYMDHVDCIVGNVHPINKNKFHNLFDNVVLNRFKYQPKLKLSSHGQRDLQLLGVACHFIFRSSISENVANAKIFFKALLKGRLSGSLSEIPSRLVTIFSVGLPMVIRYVRYRRIYSPTDQGIQLRLTAEQSLSPKSNLVLRQEVDSLGMPLISIRWHVDPSVMKTLSRFSAIVKNYFESNKIANVELDAKVTGEDADFLTSIDDANHHMGMARMSDAVEDGVVDRNLQVHGVSNLYVAGAAVFPSTGFENPTFTSMALGLRLSEFLRQKNIRNNRGS
jgi:choline dehydrogenase-like flavoprotein